MFNSIALFLYWCIYIVFIFYAIRNIKRAIIVWVPMQFLFNDLVALKFSPPVLTLSIAINFTLPIIYFIKYLKKSNRIVDLNTDSFIFKPVFIAFIFSYVISIIFTIAPLPSVINPTLKELIRSYLMIYIFYRCLNTKDDIKIFLKVALFCGILWGTLGLFEAVFRDNPIQDFIFLSSPDPTSEEYINRVYYRPPFLDRGMDVRFGIVRAYSFFNIHLAFGRTCLSYTLLFLCFLMMKKRIIEKRWLLVGLIITASGILTCNSKTPVLGLFVSLLGFFNLKNIATIRYLFIVFIVLVSIFVMIPEYWDSVMSIFDADKAAEAGGSSVEGRKGQLEVAWKLFNQNPIFGNGVGSLAAMSETGASDGILGAEGWYLAIPPERGLFGCLVYLYSYIFIYINTKMIIPSKIILFILLGQFVTESVSGLGYFVVYMPVVIVLYRYYVLKKRGIYGT